MRNTYFQFKEFIVHQHKSSMKVCTDSCLFGAWVADKIGQTTSDNGEKLKVKNILDIGAGTGLLSLMLAQKSNAEIKAVEIEENAFEQANENFAASLWSERLQAIHADINDYSPAEKFDLIISNPPFFENDLKSAHHQKNLAKHQDGLLLKELIFSIKKFLKDEGRFALLLPFHRSAEAIQIAEKEGFFLEEKLQVKQTPGHTYFRVTLLFGREKQTAKNGEITIRNEEGNYTDAFSFLLKDYYLGC